MLLLESVQRGLPKGVIDAYRNGLERHEAGETGDGLEAQTVKMAKVFVGGATPSEDWYRKAWRWWKRNARFLDEPVGSPAYASAQLWGGAAGRDHYLSYGDKAFDESALGEDAEGVEEAKSKKKKPKVFDISNVQPDWLRSMRKKESTKPKVRGKGGR